MENNKTIIRDKTNTLDKIDKLGIKGLYLDGVRRMFTAVLLLLLYTTAVQLQAQTYTGHNMVVDSTFTKNGQYIFKATESIRLRDGFKFTSGSSKTFNGKIDANMILPHDELYVENPLPVDSIEINTDLYFGTTAGMVDVSAMGGATYTIPIDISPGTNGVQPQISLVYNSQSGKGIAGMGWSISGLSAINRVGKAKYLDGVNDRVNLDYQDRFMWDGQRLMLYEGDYGYPNSEYRTEIESYNKIYARGTSGNGPEYFEVQMSNGSIMYYGKTDESRVSMKNMTTPSSFMISEMKDAYSNYIKYNYGKEGDETYIKSIEYTGNYDTVILPYNKIEFYYDTRTDKNTFYFNGNKNTSKLLLREIRSYYENEIYKRYKLTYYTKDNFSFLYSIQEISSADVKLNPMHFNYKNDLISNLEITDINFPIPDLFTSTYSKSKTYLFGDFNNDGITDILVGFYYKKGISSENSYYLYIYLGKSDGSFENDFWYYYEYDTEDENTSILIEDFDNDGYSDYLLVYKNKDNAINGSFSKKCMSFKLFLSRYLVDEYVNFICIDYDTRLYNIKDIRIGNVYDTKFKSIVCVGSSGQSLSLDENSAVCLYNLTSNLNINSTFSCQTDDEDEDLTINLYDITGNGNQNILIGIGYGIDIWEKCLYRECMTKISDIGYPSKWHTQYYGDFNGDGLIDVLTWHEDIGWEIGLNAGNLAFNHWGHTFVAPNHDKHNQYYKCSTLDINNDGFDDIVELVEISNIGSHTYGLFFHYSTGTAFVSDSIYFDGSAYNEILFTPKFLKDLFPLFLTNDSYKLYIPLEKPTSKFPIINLKTNFTSRLLTYILDGKDGLIEINYSTCLDNNIYTTDTTADYPLTIKKIPLKVVKSIKNGINSANYSYSNFTLHLEGKGIIGFQRLLKYDPKFQKQIINNYEIMSDIYLPTLISSEQKIGSFVESRTYYKTRYIKNILNGNRYFNFCVVNDTIISNNYYAMVTDFTKVDELDSLSQPTRITRKIYNDTTLTQTINTTVENISYTSTGINRYSILPSEYSSTTTKTGVPSITNKQIINYDDKGTIESTIKQFGPTPTKLDITTYYIYNNQGMTIATTMTGDDLVRHSIAKYSNDNNNKGRFPTSQTNALGHTTTASYDNKTGNVLSSTNPNGLTTNYKYDSFGQLIQTVSPSGIITETYCDWTVNLTGADIPTKPTTALFYKYQQTTGSPAQYEFYDKYGNLLRTAIQEPILSAYNWLYTDIEYDNLNRVIKKYLPSHTYNSTNKCTTYEYVTSGKYFGKISKVTSPDDSYMKYTYNNRTTTSSYYVNGSLHSQTIETVDALGNLISVDEPGGIVVYDYYSDGNVKSVTCTPKNGGTASTTTFEYDAMGNRTKINDPDAGIIKTRYNVFGEVTEQQSAEQANLGKYIRTYYDNGGRVTSQKTVTGNYPDSGSEVNLISYLYSENLPTKGMLISEINTTAKKEYSYDEYLRLSQVTETVLTDGKSFPFGYKYDSYGRLAKEIYPHVTGETENSTLEYKYDDYGYPVKKYLGTTLIWEAKEYAEQGQLSKYILGNNITVTKEFDNQGRLTNITGLKGSNTYQNMSYGYRGDGNMHFRTDAISGINKKEWFKYDTQNRLIGWETTSLNLSEPEYQIRISYEGNRISQKENIGNYGYSGFPHHGVKNSGVTTITNNALGISYDHNMIDGRARVSSIISGNNSVTYTHGTADELIKKTETKNGNTYTTYYAGGGKYELRIDNNNVETKMSYFGSGVVKYDAPGTTDDKILYLLKDHLGSVVKVLSINNNSITVKESFSYDVWGNRRNPTTWENTNITTPIYIYKGFTGHEHIEGFGLIHMKGRVYDPALGLFLSPDPYVQSATTMGFNRYSYCMGNPLMYTDPDGEFWHLIIGAAIGGLSNWIINGAEFSWKGLAYFGIGAAAGALGAGIGVGLTSVSAGTSFSAGFVGSPGGIAAITSMAPGGALWGAAIPAASVATSGFILGSGNSWLKGNSFKEGLKQGAVQGLIGGISAGVLGGITGGITAVQNGSNFWRGKASPILVDQSWNIDRIVDDQPGYCVKEFTESADRFYGISREDGFYSKIHPDWSPKEFALEYNKLTDYDNISNQIGSRSENRYAIGAKINSAAGRNNVVGMLRQVKGEEFSHINAIERFTLYENGRIIILDNNGVTHILPKTPANKALFFTETKHFPFYLFELLKK